MEKCYVCGYGPHAPTDLHRYWSETDAAAEFAAEPQGDPHYVPADFRVYGS